MLSQLISGRISVPDYAALLAAYHAVFAPLEERLYGRTDLLALVPDLAQRRKAGLLEQDLADLAHLAGLRDQEVRRRPPVDVPLDGTARGMGCLYVLEGSTLGGQVLAGRVAASGTLPVGQGSAFFHSYGPLVPARWRAFKNALNVLALSAEDLGAMSDSACATFAAFIATVAPLGRRQ